MTDTKDDKKKPMTFEELARSRAALYQNIGNIRAQLVSIDSQESVDPETAYDSEAANDSEIDNDSQTGTNSQTGIGSQAGTDDDIITSEKPERQPGVESLLAKCAGLEKALEIVSDLQKDSDKKYLHENSLREKAESTVSETADKYQKLLKKKKRYNKELKSKKQELESLNTQYEALEVTRQQDYDRLTEKIKILEEENSLFETGSDELKQSLTASEKKYKREVEVLEEKVTYLEEKLMHSSVNVEALENSLSDVSLRTDTLDNSMLELSQVKGVIETELEITRGKLSDSESEGIELAESLTSSQSKVSELEESLVSSESKVSELEESISTLAAKALEQAQAYSVSEGSVSELEENLTSSESKVSELEVSLATSESKVSELEVSFATSESKVSALEENLAAAELRVAELEENFTSSDDKLSELQESLTVSDSKTSEVHDNFIASEKKVSVLQSTLEKSELKVTEISAELKISSSTVSTLREEVEALEKLTTTSKTHLQDSENSVHTYLQKIDSLEKKVLMLTDEASGNKSLLENELSSSCDENNELIAQIENLKGELTSVEQDRLVLFEERELLEKQLSDVVIQNESNKGKLKKSESKTKGSSDEIVKLQGELSYFNKQILEISEQKDVLAASLALEEEHHAAVIVELSEQKARYILLNSENNEIKEGKTDIESQIKELESRNEELANELLLVAPQKDEILSDNEFMMSKCEDYEAQIVEFKLKAQEFIKLEAKILELEDERDKLATLRNAGLKRIQLLEEEKGLLDEDLVQTSDNLKEVSKLLEMFKDGER